MGYPTASTYPEISGAASGTTPTEPTITVTGRANGGTYTVSAGARSLSIGNPGGATLATTVNDTSGAVSVTGDATTSPSWTAPSGGSSGEATQVRVVATDSATGLSSEFSFTEFIDGSATPTPTWEELDTWTFAGADLGSLSASGTITRDSGATNVVAYVSATQTGSVASEVREIVAAGLRVYRVDGASVGIVSFPMADILAACNEGRDKLVALVKLASIANVDANNQNWNIGVSSSSSSVSANPSRGVETFVASAGDIDHYVRQYTSGVTRVKLADYGAAMPSSGAVMLEIDVDRVRGGWSDLSSPVRSDVTMGTIGGSSESPSATLPTCPYNYLYIANNPQSGGELDLVISEIVWYRLALGAT